MILIVGATGFVGQRVTRRLIERGQRVRAMVRPAAAPSKVSALGDGVEIVRGDLKQPATLAAACQGVDTVISTASATISRSAGDDIFTVDRDGQLALVEAARAAGVGHFIYLSFSGGMDVPSPLLDAKRAVELSLQNSGMAFTIVRPTIFMEVWLSPHAGFDPVGGTVRIYGAGDAPVSVISALDVAEYIASCVGNPSVRNRIIELGGPEPISPNAIVSLFEGALGRPIQKQHVPETALEQQRTAAQDPLQKTLAALALGVARGDVIDNRKALECAPISLTPVREYISRVTGTTRKRMSSD